MIVANTVRRAARQIEYLIVLPGHQVFQLRFRSFVTVHSLPERNTTFIYVLLYDLYESKLGRSRMKEEEKGRKEGHAPSRPEQWDAIVSLSSPIESKCFLHGSNLCCTSSLITRNTPHSQPHASKPASTRSSLLA